MLKKIHYSDKFKENHYLLYSCAFVILALITTLLAINSSLIVNARASMNDFLNRIMFSFSGTLYQLYWLFSAAVVLYGFMALGWFRILTKISTVILFLALGGVVRGTAQVGFIKDLHDMLHVFLLPAYEAGYILFTALWGIVYPLCLATFSLFEWFFNLPVINVLFSIACWIIDFALTANLPAKEDFLYWMGYLDRQGNFSAIPYKLSIALQGNTFGSYFNIMDYSVQRFFDFFTYFVIMYLFVEVFFKVALFCTTFINHGIRNYFTFDNHDEIFLENNPNVLEVLYRSKRRHPFKMPWRISIRESRAAYMNAFVTSRTSIYIDSKLVEENKGVLAHELGHVVHGDSIHSRVNYAFYIAVFVVLTDSAIGLLQLWVSNILFFIIGCCVGTLFLWSISILLSVSNIVSAVFFMFSGKWSEFMADMYAVSLGYGWELLGFFCDPDAKFSEIILGKVPGFERRKFSDAFSDPHPSTKNRALYLKLCCTVLSLIPFTSYHKAKKSGAYRGNVKESVEMVNSGE